MAGLILLAANSATGQDDNAARRTKVENIRCEVSIHNPEVRPKAKNEIEITLINLTGYGHDDQQSERCTFPFKLSFSSRIRAHRGRLRRAGQLGDERSAKSSAVQGETSGNIPLRHSESPREARKPSLLTFQLLNGDN